MAEEKVDTTAMQNLEKEMRDKMEKMQKMRVWQARIERTAIVCENGMDLRARRRAALLPSTRAPSKVEEGKGNQAG